MRAVIDILLIIILAYCTWMGRRHGLVNTAISILALVIALYGGSLISATFSGQFAPAFEPFAGGLLDTNRDKALADMGYGASDLSLEDIVAKDKTKKYDYCLHVYEQCGIHTKSAGIMAKEAQALSDTKNIPISIAAEQTFCADILHVAGTVLVGLILFIVFTVIENLANFTFHIPNAPKTELYGGIAAGALKGFILCVLFCWLLGFCGLIIGKQVLYKSILTRFFLLFGFVTAGIL